MIVQLGKRTFSQRQKEPSINSASRQHSDMQSSKKNNGEKHQYNEVEEINNSIEEEESFNSDDELKQVEELSECDESQPNKKKRVKRSSENKKLVFLSKKVLEEVSSKKETTGTNHLDFKNVQRRVYDALNVLSALDVITKDRNRIVFKGYGHLMLQGMKDQKSHEETDHIALKKLIQRNFLLKKEHRNIQEQKLDLPFVVFKLEKESKVDLIMSDEKDQLIFSSNRPLKIYNDNHVFEATGLNKCNNEELKQLLPQNLVKFLQEKLKLQPDNSLESQMENLMCDEPISMIDIKNNPQQHYYDYKHQDFLSQDYFQSQHSQSKSSPIRNFSQFEDESSMISNTNSISGTPIKPKITSQQPQYKGSSQKQFNPYNLASPFKPVNDHYDMEQNLTDNGLFNQFYLHNSPFLSKPGIGGNTLLNNNNIGTIDIFHDNEESTKNDSNLSNQTRQSMNPPMGIITSQLQRSPFNVHQILNSNQHPSHENQGTPLRPLGKVSPAGGIISLSQIMKDHQQLL